MQSPRKSGLAADRSKSKSPGKNKMRQSSKSAGKSNAGRKSSGPKKHTYVEMIQTALMTLNERGGSSRQEIWKFINAKFPESHYKMFLVRLKKYSREGGFLL